MGRGFIELHDDYGFRYLVNIDKIVSASLGHSVAKLADSWNSR